MIKFPAVRADNPTGTPSYATGSMGRIGLPRAYQEMLGMTEKITTAGVDWTIVRFTAPKDTPKTGKRRVGFYGTNKIGFAVSRTDIAAFTAVQVDDPTYLRAAPAISN